MDLVEGLALLVEYLGQDGDDVELLLDLGLGEAEGLPAGQLELQAAGLGPRQAPGAQCRLWTHWSGMPEDSHGTWHDDQGLDGGVGRHVEELGVADQPGAVLEEDPLRPPLGKHLGGDGGGRRP